MSRCRGRPSVSDDRCKHDTPIRKDSETRMHQHFRTHASPHVPHLDPSTSNSEKPIASPPGFAAPGRLFCCSSSHCHCSTSCPSFASPHYLFSCSSSSSCSSSGSSSSDSSDYSANRANCGRRAQQCLYWLDVLLWRFIGFIADLGRYFYSLWLLLPLDVVLLKGDYEPLRRKALAVAGLLALLACWFWVPMLSQQPSVTTTSGTNLAKIQQQLMDIQKQLAEKEARWKEILLKEIASLQNEETITSGLKVELSNWLQEFLLAGSSSGAEGVVLWPDLRGVLESMEIRLAQQLAASQDVQKAVKEALNRYRNDGTGMPDYALIYSGGKVIKSQYTEPQCPNSLQVQTEGPSAVIQPEVYPGQCWAFRGSYGSVTIALSQPVNITHVTMEHLPKSLSPTGQTDSAPQDFAVYGIVNVDQQQQGDFIGKFTYSTDGDPIQTFELKGPGKEFYPVVELRILTNWGNPMYTCVYRFRVHGQPKNA